MLSVKESIDGNLSTRGRRLTCSEIQATVLRQRPAPYFGTHVLLRVDDAASGPRISAPAGTSCRFRRELVERDQCLAVGRDHLCGP